MTTYGVNACPPCLVGIGIAGSSEVAAKQYVISFFGVFTIWLTSARALSESFNPLLSRRLA